MGILDTIIDTQQQQSLRQFELNLIVNKILEPLKEREKHILAKRYGLQGHKVATLKTVGEEQGLTRERVRQIEKDLLKNLRRTIQNERELSQARDLLVNTILDHGGIMAEASLLEFLNIANEDETNGVRFLLNLMRELEPVKHDRIKQAWAGIGYNKGLIQQFLDESKKVFEAHGKPMNAGQFLDKFRETEFYQQHAPELNHKVLTNLLHASADLEQNVFEEFGLSQWNEIKPKDVGDKAYLVMKHHGKPEHYAIITELINKHGVDKRTAYKETVHNKLIKDPRFVLVGRGIYALGEWGYKPGVVSDMIKEILAAHGRPMSRDEIVAGVLNRRLVKKNTILVGLSNKKLFKKVGKNLYTLA
jgi:hypothetical protein